MAHIRSLFCGGPVTDAEDRALQALRAGRPSHVVWNVTDRCNLRCRHCYMAATGARAGGELTTEEALQVVSLLGDAGVPLLFMTGGELFCRPDAWALLEAAHETRMRLVVSTNGTLIGREGIRRLRALGVDFTAVSIYGSRDFHDGYVALPGAFDRTIETARLMREEGIGVAVKCVVNTDTLPHLPGVFETAERLGARVVYACDLVTAGRAEDMAARAVSAADWRGLAAVIAASVADDPDGLEYDLGAIPSAVPYIADRLAERGVDVGRALDRLGTMSACPVGHGHMAISATGDILPCQFMQDYAVGNVRTTSLEEAVETLFEMGRTPVGGACGACEHARLCRGCRAKAHCVSGDVLGEDPACVLEGTRAPA